MGTGAWPAQCDRIHFSNELIQRSSCPATAVEVYDLRGEGDNLLYWCGGVKLRCIDVFLC